METVVMDIVRVGLAATIFILVMKIIFVGFNIPIGNQIFGAV